MLVLDDFFSKWRQCKSCQAEVHHAEWYANECDAEDDAKGDVGQTYPDASDEEPQYVHEKIQTSCLRTRFLNS